MSTNATAWPLVSVDRLLQAFCGTPDDDLGARFDFTRPWFRGGFRYATNAHVIVRVTAEGEPDTPIGVRPFPPLAKIKQHWDVSRKPVPTPSFDALPGLGADGAEQWRTTVALGRNRYNADYVQLLAMAGASFCAPWTSDPAMAVGEGWKALVMPWREGGSRAPVVPVRVRSVIREVMK